MVGILAGCNSSDSLYSQGPWGHPDAYRGYPQYASPWGRRIPGVRVVTVPGLDQAVEVMAPSSGVKSLAETGPYQHLTALPPDPHPSISPTETAIPVSPIVSEQAPVPKGPQPQVAAPVLASGESPPGVFSAPRRASSYAGTWKARDHKGDSCLIQLSSVASLDLYKASVSRCSNEALRQVNSWSFNENRIVLFSRGAEIAQLTGSEAALSGSLSKAGTSLQMSR
ncbi:AprI/Inh family metalloprotease inhibitor [Microvirga sp. G4-2]|uniref:AprI/Inh family metalloprotease inhibitor n=1 Tax=Microvirga sp. G4-2 TaxID=3434467 RepID=UPI004044650B